MRTEIITDQFVNLDAFERTQKVKRVYVNDSGKLLLKDQIWTMDWSLEHKREVAADLKSDNYIAYPDSKNRIQRNGKRCPEKRGGGYPLAAAEPRHLPSDAVSGGDQSGGIHVQCSFPHYDVVQGFGNCYGHREFRYRNRNAGGKHPGICYENAQKSGEGHLVLFDAQYVYGKLLPCLWEQCMDLELRRSPGLDRNSLDECEFRCHQPAEHTCGDSRSGIRCPELLPILHHPSGLLSGWIVGGSGV